MKWKKSHLGTTRIVQLSIDKSIDGVQNEIKAIICYVLSIFLIARSLNASFSIAFLLLPLLLSIANKLDGLKWRALSLSLQQLSIFTSPFTFAITLLQLQHEVRLIVWRSCHTTRQHRVILGMCNVSQQDSLIRTVQWNGRFQMSNHFDPSNKRYI